MGDRLTAFGGDAGRARSRRSATTRWLLVALVPGLLALAAWRISGGMFDGANGSGTWAAIAAGVAAGLALAAASGTRDLVRDLVRGLALRVQDRVRVGDFVEIAGHAGVVEQVGLCSVALRDDDGAVHFVPAGGARSLTNRSYGRTYALVDVPLAANEDLDRAIAAMAETVAAMRREPGQSLRILDVLEVAGVERWDRDGLTVRARVCVAPGQAAAVRRQLLTAFHRRFGTDAELPVESSRLSNLTVA